MYQLLPPLSLEELQQLRDDIAENGIRVPVDTDEHGNILDGHHRAAIASELGIELPTRVIPNLSEQAKRDHAVAVNLHRRQLSREQKRQLIEASLRADPHLSNREQAERTNVDHKTVGVVRRQLQATGEIPQLDRTVGADGKERPATRTAPATFSPVPDPVRTNAAPFQRATPPTTAETVDHSEGDARRDAELDALMEDTAVRFRRNFGHCLAQADDLWQFDPDRIADVYASDFDRAIRPFLEEMTGWCERVTAAYRRSRTGLRVVNGGRA